VATATEGGVDTPRETLRDRFDRFRDWAADHPELAALAVLLVVGAILRIYFLVQWRPALVGYSDSGIYFMSATGHRMFSDPIRLAGYGMFLRAFHWIWPHLVLVIVVQHAMGLVTAVLLFAIVRRIGGPVGLGLVPAAVVCLGGDQLFWEHAALSETLFTYAVVGGLYGAIRAWRDAPWWGLLAGVGIGLSVTVRGAGTMLVPLVIVWLLFAPGRPTMRSLTSAGLALAVCVAVIGGYIAWREADTGLSGLTTNGDWNLYGRVAPWADCTKFTPPAGTEGLCDPTPPDQRLGRSPLGPGPGLGGNHVTGENYIFGPSSPAQRMFGPPFEVSPDPDANAKLRKWSLAAIKGQPLDYLAAVWNDSVRVVFPDHRSFGDLSADENIGFLTGGPDMHSGQNDFVQYWQTLLYPDDDVYHGTIAYLRDYEAMTRVEGIWMLLLLALALAAPFVAPRRVRAGAILLTLVSFTLIWFPIVSKSYDFRFIVPALGPLAAAAALGGWGCFRRMKARSIASP
jgi:hypothetical protein